MAEQKNKVQTEIVYTVGLGILHVWLFMKLLSLASNFVRIYANVYQQNLTHVLIILFGAAFFILFRNMTFLAQTVSAESGSVSALRKITFGSILIFFAILLLQIVPEYMLTVAYEIK